MRRTAEEADLTAIVHRALENPKVTGIERLKGGSKKGVYRVHLAGSGPASVVVYNWADDENFWPQDEEYDEHDAFAPANGQPRFLHAHRVLEEAGVRVPRIHLVEAEMAVIEDLPAGSLEALYESDPVQAEAVTEDLARILRRMHANKATSHGTIAHLTQEITCEQGVFQRALTDLAEAARREERIGAVETQLRRKLEDLYAKVTPRQDYSLIHGELGPDHVLVTPDAEAVLIDIEGLMYFDVEWEHVFLELRFNERYPVLAPSEPLDEDRMRLYRLAMRLSLVAGPLRLLDGDFPDRAVMRQIAEWNLEAALKLLEA